MRFSCFSAQAPKAGSESTVSGVPKVMSPICFPPLFHQVVSCYSFIWPLVLWGTLRVPVLWITSMTDQSLQKRLGGLGKFGDFHQDTGTPECRVGMGPGERCWTTSGHAEQRFLCGTQEKAGRSWKVQIDSEMKEPRTQTLRVTAKDMVKLPERLIEKESV